MWRKVVARTKVEGCADAAFVVCSYGANTYFWRWSNRNSAARRMSLRQADLKLALEYSAKPIRRQVFRPNSLWRQDYRVGAGLIVIKQRKPAVSLHLVMRTRFTCWRWTIRHKPQ